MWVFGLVFLFPFALIAFEAEPVTPHPVVGFQEITYPDNLHKSYRALSIWYPVKRTIEGKPSRSPWDVFYVVENAEPVLSKPKVPLIILSHGYTGNPHQLSWLIRGLVDGGSVVIAVQHLDKINDKVHLNHWKRAKDVGEIIDQFSKHPLAAKTDFSKIGIVGYSLGGTTALQLAGGRAMKLDQVIPGAEYASPEDFKLVREALFDFDKKMMAKDWRDNRIKAAFVMAPAWAWLFDEVSLRTVTIPTYLIASAGDRVLSTQNNAGFFAKYIPKSFFQIIEGKGDHYVFISALNEPMRNKADPDGTLAYLFEDDPSVDRQWIQYQTSKQAVDFFNSVFFPDK